MNALLEDLTWRGLLANSTDPRALEAQLDEGPVTFYVGFDPTGPSLHIGHLVQLLTARRLQAAGHRPLILVGGATGLIGDPKASGERVMNSKEVVAGWVSRLREQSSQFVSFEGENAARMVNNLDWASSISAIDFLRDIGKYFPVNRMLDREIVKSRLESGISFTEFSYVLLQSMDYLELFRRYGCRLQTGGSDQWGNITAGVELVRRASGEHVHALATPLLLKSDGTKFGKTEGGGVWLDPAMTSAYALHQFFLNAEDSKVIEYLKAMSFRSREEIMDLEQQTLSSPHRRAAQHALADDVTDLVHGEIARRHAEEAARAVFGSAELARLDEPTLAAVMAEIKAVEIDPTDGHGPAVVSALVASGVVASKSAARRAIEEGGAYLNNVKVTDIDQTIEPEDLLAGRYAVLRRGKHTIGAVRVNR
ncbi:tyrosyl-tRNA synthetase [Propionibacterium cyclohexanicum]|uniref:Tyrosine--tRNA ligase n=1 Tax=Propionibacterium cyclohexanicum TaxID=64702 RepID=A0A1H9PSZ4_9ACTN|nr:tyrosine--tRNA ligase [Propionibacterium cyclohexanicum]SER51347.1 tyrosyl-tRNA synthetase [Propionibacterium cyclohexanicum]